MNSIFNGLLIGFGTAFILGPVFFTLLKNSHNFGIKGGIFTALGILVSDIFVVAICYYFTGDILDKYIHQPWLKWAAACVLFILGYRFVTQPAVNKESNAASQITNPLLKSFIQGFLVNFVNPAVFVIWITFIGFAKADYADDNTAFWSFILGILLGIFSTDIIKSFAADYVTSKIKNKFFEYIFKSLGVILILMALRLCYMAFISM